MEECVICFELLENNIGILKCGHKYHFECLTNWMNTKNNFVKFCPQCPETPNEIVNVLCSQNSNFSVRKINEKNETVSDQKKKVCIIQ